MFTNDELKELLGKRIIVVAREKLKEVSASFAVMGYSGYSGYSGTSGTSGKSGYSGRGIEVSKQDEKYILKLEKVTLISFENFLIREFSDDFYFVRAASPVYSSSSTNDFQYGVWYTSENFFDVYNVLKVLPAEFNS